MRRISGFFPVCLLALSAVLTSTVACGLAAAETPEPPDYRMEDFRAPVPNTLAGGTVVSVETARELIEGGKVVLIDVLPRPPRPKGLPEGTIWRPTPRYNIPRSIWLPNTGFGALSDHVERYFRNSLERLTENDKSRKILFYCLADCWMSWNAAKRAISYGYRSVYWFPEGTDAWTALGLPTDRSEPEPGWNPD
ncbi:MAG: PQQ-dependent catabolism-associated CXXCW motif protein [Rhodospirillales bacterium]|nr:PQQ-dependent catabolism-associated CXXCW motif protein [Rhodospirillales bacterium]MDH3910873.1 PQQ-dependent catabolism-associated CXXCW motif protein [Rhodospirillales bacterium]MDH3967951.1 PQQ-dependent catabolism-associated CXXCW motif protein [Rhodospirillales bacterium]